MPLQLHDPVGRNVERLSQEYIGAHQQYQSRTKPGDTTPECLIQPVDPKYESSVHAAKYKNGRTVHCAAIFVFCGNDELILVQASQHTFYLLSQPQVH
jgi:hypothetical protein